MVLGRLSWRWVQRLGDWLGAWLVWTSSDTLAVVRANIDHCFPEQSEDARRRLMVQSVRYFGRVSLEMAWVWRQTPEAVLARVKAVHGHEHITQAMDAGRGVVLLAPHLGNWEVLSLWVASQWPVTSMYQPGKYPELDQFVKNARSRLNSQLVPTTRRGIAQLLSVLKAGGAVGVLPDQEPPPQSGVFVPLFGQPALTTTLSVKLVQHTQAAVLCVFAQQRSDGDYEIVCLPAHDDVGSGDVEAACAAMNRSIEQCIAHCPEQYQWSYKRFKTGDHGLIYK